MKTLIGLLTLMAYGCIQAQTHHEKITKELAFEKISTENAIIVANIFGNVTIEGYSGDKVLLEVEKTVNAKTQTRLDKGKETIQLGIIDRADTLIFYTKGLCIQFGKNKRNGEKDSGGWGYDWNNCDHGNLDFDYNMNYNIKVPPGVNVIVSTVNNGNIKIDKVSGAVVANNVNGGISLSDMIQAVRAHTINGDVNVNYIKHPVKECRFYTLNGNINANFPKGLAANVQFKSFNGEFYTNLSQLDNLPVEIQKEPSANGTKFSVNGNRFKAGKGGTLLDFETFNGNVYLKENQ